MTCPPANGRTGALELYRTIYEAVREVKPDTLTSLAVPERQPARPGDIRRSCLVVERSRKEIGWAARVDVPAGVRLTFRWWMSEKPASFFACPLDTLP